VDRSLRETAPGVYETAVKLRGAGEYDLAFFVDSPRVIHCFDFTVAESPEVAALRTRGSVAVEVQVPDGEVEVGRPVEVTIRVTDLASDRGKEGLKDVRVLTFLAPGVWQQRQLARAAGDGRYRVDFTPPQPGVYYVFVEIASEKIGFNESPSAALRARAGSPAEVEGREDGAIKAPSKGEPESESEWEGGLE
jgi:hypothetical protein